MAIGHPWKNRIQHWKNTAENKHKVYEQSRKDREANKLKEVYATAKLRDQTKGVYESNQKDLIATLRYANTRPKDVNPEQRDDAKIRSNMLITAKALRNRSDSILRQLNAYKLGVKTFRAKLLDTKKHYIDADNLEYLNHFFSMSYVEKEVNNMYGTINTLDNLIHFLNNDSTQKHDRNQDILDHNLVGSESFLFDNTIKLIDELDDIQAFLDSRNTALNGISQYKPVGHTLNFNAFIDTLYSGDQLGKSAIFPEKGMPHWPFYTNLQDLVSGKAMTAQDNIAIQEGLTTAFLSWMAANYKLANGGLMGNANDFIKADSDPHHRIEPIYYGYNEFKNLADLKVKPFCYFKIDINFDGFMDLNTDLSKDEKTKDPKDNVKYGKHMIGENSDEYKLRLKSLDELAMEGIDVRQNEYMLLQNYNLAKELSIKLKSQKFFDAQEVNIFERYVMSGLKSNDSDVKAYYRNQQTPIQKDDVWTNILNNKYDKRHNSLASVINLANGSYELKDTIDHDRYDKYVGPSDLFVNEDYLLVRQANVIAAYLDEVDKAVGHGFSIRASLLSTVREEYPASPDNYPIPNPEEFFTSNKTVELDKATLLRQFNYLSALISSEDFTSKAIDTSNRARAGTDSELMRAINKHVETFINTQKQANPTNSTEYDQAKTDYHTLVQDNSYFEIQKNLNKLYDDAFLAKIHKDYQALTDELTNQGFDGLNIDNIRYDYKDKVKKAISATLHDMVQDDSISTIKNNYINDILPRTKARQAAQKQAQANSVKNTIPNYYTKLKSLNKSIYYLSKHEKVLPKLQKRQDKVNRFYDAVYSPTRRGFNKLKAMMTSIPRRFKNIIKNHYKKKIAQIEQETKNLNKTIESLTNELNSSANIQNSDFFSNPDDVKYEEDQYASDVINGNNDVLAQEVNRLNDLVANDRLGINSYSVTNSVLDENQGIDHFLNERYDLTEAFLNEIIPDDFVPNDSVLFRKDDVFGKDTGSVAFYTNHISMDDLNEWKKTFKNLKLNDPNYDEERLGWKWKVFKNAYMKYTIPSNLISASDQRNHHFNLKDFVQAFNNKEMDFRDLQTFSQVYNLLVDKMFPQVPKIYVPDLAQIDKNSLAHDRIYKSNGKKDDNGEFETMTVDKPDCFMNVWVSGLMMDNNSNAHRTTYLHHDSFQNTDGLNPAKLDAVEKPNGAIPTYPRDKFERLGFYAESKEGKQLSGLQRKMLEDAKKLWDPYAEMERNAYEKKRTTRYEFNKDNANLVKTSDELVFEDEFYLRDQFLKVDPGYNKTHNNIQTSYQAVFLDGIKGKNPQNIDTKFTFWRNKDLNRLYFDRTILSLYNDKYFQKEVDKAKDGFGYNVNRVFDIVPTGIKFDPATGHFEKDSRPVNPDGFVLVDLHTKTLMVDENGYNLTINGRRRFTNDGVQCLDFFGNPVSKEYSVTSDGWVLDRTKHRLFNSNATKFDTNTTNVMRWYFEQHIITDRSRPDENGNPLTIPYLSLQFPYPLFDGDKLDEFTSEYWRQFDNIQDKFLEHDNYNLNNYYKLADKDDTFNVDQYLSADPFLMDEQERAYQQTLHSLSVLNPYERSYNPDHEIFNGFPWDPLDPPSFRNYYTSFEEYAKTHPHWAKQINPSNEIWKRVEERYWSSLGKTNKLAQPYYVLYQNKDLFSTAKARRLLVLNHIGSKDRDLVNAIVNNEYLYFVFCTHFQEEFKPATNYPADTNVLNDDKTIKMFKDRLAELNSTMTNDDLVEAQIPTYSKEQLNAMEDDARLLKRHREVPNVLNNPNLAWMSTESKGAVAQSNAYLQEYNKLAQNAKKIKVVKSEVNATEADIPTNSPIDSPNTPIDSPTPPTDIPPTNPTTPDITPTKNPVSDVIPETQTKATNTNTTTPTTPTTPANPANPTTTSTPLTKAKPTQVKPHFVSFATELIPEGVYLGVDYDSLVNQVEVVTKIETLKNELTNNSPLSQSLKNPDVTNFYLHNADFSANGITPSMDLHSVLDFNAAKNSKNVATYTSMFAYHFRSNLLDTKIPQTNPVSSDNVNTDAINDLYNNFTNEPNKTDVMDYNFTDAQALQRYWLATNKALDPYGGGNDPETKYQIWKDDNLNRPEFSNSTIPKNNIYHQFTETPRGFKNDSNLYPTLDHKYAIQVDEAYAAKIKKSASDYFYHHIGTTALLVPSIDGKFMRIEDAALYMPEAGLLFRALVLGSNNVINALPDEIKRDLLKHVEETLKNTNANVPFILANRNNIEIPENRKKDLKANQQADVKAEVIEEPKVETQTETTTPQQTVTVNAEAKKPQDIEITPEPEQEDTVNTIKPQDIEINLENPQEDTNVATNPVTNNTTPSYTKTPQDIEINLEKPVNNKTTHLNPTAVLVKPEAYSKTENDDATSHITDPVVRASMVATLEKIDKVIQDVASDVISHILSSYGANTIRQKVPHNINDPILQHNITNADTLNDFLTVISQKTIKSLANKAINIAHSDLNSVQKNAYRNIAMASALNAIASRFNFETKNGFNVTNEMLDGLGLDDKVKSVIQQRIQNEADNHDFAKSRKYEGVFDNFKDNIDEITRDNAYIQSLIKPAENNVVNDTQTNNEVKQKTRKQTL